MSRQRATGPQQQLPAALAILAVSIAALAAVLIRMENGRERRFKNGQQSLDDNTCRSAVTGENGCCSCQVRPSPPGAARDREMLAEGAAAAATAATAAATPGASSLRYSAPVQAGSAYCAAGGASGGCRCCAWQVATAAAPAAAAASDFFLTSATRRATRLQQQHQSSATATNCNAREIALVQARNNTRTHPHGHGDVPAVIRTTSPLSAAASSAGRRDRCVGLVGEPLPQPARPGALFSLPDASERVMAGAAAGTEAEGGATAPSGRRLELLVHNVSHKDMVLSLRRTRLGARPRLHDGEPGNPIHAPDTALARPKFSLFKPSSELVLNKLQEMRAAGRGEPPPAVCEVYRRSETGSAGPSSPLQERGAADADGGSDRDVNEVDGVGYDSDTDTKRHRHRRRRLPLGFDFGDTPIPISDLAGYRVRTEDLDRLAPPGRKITKVLHKAMNRRDSSGFFMVGGNAGRASLPAQDTGGGHQGHGKGGEPGAKKKEATKVRRKGKQGRDLGGGDIEGEAFISGVYFPLLSVLMPSWMEQLAGSGDVGSAKTVLLVSGVGRPRNQRHREEDNSTEVTAMLMEAFLDRHYPDVRVIRVHSDTNIFRYDDNIRFVKTELLPLLNLERSKMAEKYGGDWQDMMHITMSFADGSPARISSINTALRHFRPSFIHIWELKTFWHERIICEDDVEVHTFEDIDMLPPMPASEVDQPTALIIAEMLRLRGDLERILAAPPRGGVVGGDARDDLAAFWLRKTKKPVLAVLLVQKKGGQPQLYRGTNMEVSMPTGSLCAERNVIGSALAADLSLLRSDIKAVAVLAVARLGRPPTTATPAGGVAADASFVSSAVGGRSGGAGLASAGTSVMGSSAPSRVASPFTLTPALVASPVGARGRGGAGGKGTASGPSRRAFSAWAWDAEDDAQKLDEERVVVVGDEDDDEKRLEGVRQALLAVADGTNTAAAKDPEKVPPNPSPEEGSNGGGGGGESNGGSGGGSGQKTPQKGTEAAQATVQFRASTRFRSESCADELLAAGRVPSREALLGCGGEGRSAIAAGCAPAGGIPRSKSFDWGAELGSRRASFESSTRKMPRGTKVVRSMASVPSPRRAGLGRGGRDGGGGGGGGGGCGGEGNMRAERTSRRGESGGESWGGNGGGRGASARSSIVAHVPAEPLCSNPLKPCGACMEWLKKIAEVNPDFKVITFTDSLCSGVYIEDVAQIL